MTVHTSRPNSSKIYVIMGVSGCGKSSVGAAVAQKLGLAFMEGDSLHPPANIEKMSRGIPLTDDDRFPWLDLIGKEIESCLFQDKGLVISCSSLKRIYRDRLRNAAHGQLTFIFLRGSEELLTERMAHRSGHFMPVSLLKSQLATLEDPSSEPNVLTVDIEGTQAEVLQKTFAALGLTS